MQTFFASAERDSKAEISEQVAYASNNPVIDSILHISGGVIAVLNKHRQIVAVNDTLLSFLGLDNPEDLFGLRPGEAIKCVHADELEGGCGTSSWCASCGAAISIVATLADKNPQERKCAAVVKKGDAYKNLCFSVRTASIQGDFILLYLQDISVEEQRAAFERMYNHDIKNILTGITCSAEILDESSRLDNAESICTIKKLSMRLRSEILLHASLSGNDESKYKPVLKDIAIKDILDELQIFFKGHFAAVGKTLYMSIDGTEVSFRSDYSLLLRILTNLLINAFEAAMAGETIKCIVSCTEKNVIFTIWNKAYISPIIAKRIFQQYFSTKSGSGRGFGTFGSKFICENYLNGSIDFESSEIGGTFFRVALPR